MNLDDSDEEQDLHGLRTSIFNKFPSLLPQTITATPPLSTQPNLGLKHSKSESRAEQLEHSIAEQIIEQIDMPEHQNIEQVTEQTIKPITTDQISRVFQIKQIHLQQSQPCLL